MRPLIEKHHTSIVIRETTKELEKCIKDNFLSVDG